VRGFNCPEVVVMAGLAVLGLDGRPALAAGVLERHSDRTGRLGSVIHGQRRDRRVPQHEGRARRNWPEVAPLGQVAVDARRAVGPAFGRGVDHQRPGLVRAAVAHQAHRQPIELGEVVQVRVGQQHLVDHVHAVALLELQERRDHAHPDVDQRVPHDLPVAPLHHGVRGVGLAIGIAVSCLVGARAVLPPLEPEGGLDAVDPQQQLA